jgi:hypothetical protein
MFALHAVWRADRRLALWAEDSLLPPDRYACAPETVAQLLGGTGPGLEWLMTKAAEGVTTLLLPTQNGVPLPSPELGRAVQGPRAPVTLAPWRVPSLLLEPGEAAQLLGELYAPGKPFLPTQLPAEGPVDVPYGASLRWLTAVHDLAWRLVGRGQVLPAVATEDGRPYARWRPVPDADGWRETRELTAAVPPVCRAERSGGHPDGRASGELVADLLDVLADCEARAALEDEPPLLRPGRVRSPDGVPEAWLRALGSDSGRVEGADAAALAGLRDRLDAWYRSEAPADEPLRTCFRLGEPLGPDPADPGGDPSDDNWRLEFLLQAADEPSLMVAADALWVPGAALSALERKAPRPGDALLDGLARAARLWPPLREALRASHPTALRLDRAGALAFLRDAAPALAAAGHGVLLPTWWQRPAGFGLTLSVRTAQPGLVHDRSLLDRDRIVAFRWRAAVGDQPLTEAELTELAAAKQPLVRLRGQWTEVDPARIAAALAFLERRGRGTMAAGEVLRVALDPDATVGGLPVAGVSADGRLGDLLAGTADHHVDPVPVPAEFGATLRPYQERGLDWLAFMSRLGLGAVLADDMGLGKTVQTLALLAVEHAEGVTAPNLLVCPMSLVGNWQREAARFAPMLRVHVHHGAQRLSGDALRRAVQGADLVVTTYGLAERDAAELRALQWRRVIADEAQHIKNSATRQAVAVRSLPATHRIALTGTPVENRLAELHAVLDFANPGLFGSAARFKERWSIPIERDGHSDTAAELQRHTRPFILRRLKNDPVIARDLPEKVEMTVNCGLTAEQAGLYRAAVSDMLARIAESRGIERKGIVLSTLTKLKQICNHPAQFLHEPYEGASARLIGRSGKLERLEEILAEALAEGDKVLCFTQFAEFGRLLHGHLARRLGREVLFLHGGVPKHARDAMTARFQDPAGPAVFLLSLKAGGTGLNLTAAAHVIHLDRWWNPAVEDQATDRAFRIGQRRNVQVRKFVCAGTIEERIDAMIEAKRTLAGSVVGDGEQWLTELSTDELRDLVELSADDGEEST